MLLNVKNSGNEATVQAAEWFVRLNSGRETAQDHVAFLEWLSKSPRHQSEFDLIEANWELAGALEGDPEFMACLEAPVSPPEGAGAPRRFWWGIAAALALFVLTALGLWAGPDGDDHRTAVGEQKVIHLADGSLVHLNTNTEILVSFDERFRRVRLKRGEAIFSVKKDKARPFVVAAGERKVRAVGTEFDVLKIGDRVKVAVLRGIVEVSPAATAKPRPGDATTPAQRLLPGQQITYDVGSRVVARQAADISRITAWRTGWLRFDAATLAEVVAELNHYSARKTVIGDAALKDIRVSGSFRIGDTEAVIRALQESFAIRAIPTNRGFVLVAREASG